MSKRKIKCRKCTNEVDVSMPACHHCGAILTIKSGMLNKKALKSMKEIA